MADFSTSPNWQAEGVEPPENLKEEGFTACYNHTVLYFYNSELGYYNGDVDEYFSELIGYDTSKYLS